MDKSNLFEGIPAELPAELETQLAQGRAFRLKRIVSRGQSTDWYDQDEDEWVLLVTGAARLEFEGNAPMELAAGDYTLIPAHCKHRVAWTDPERESVWLAIYFEG
ncbi:MAG: cupin domain-containing protein [Porticoccaceae bacterium]